MIPMIRWSLRSWQQWTTTRQGITRWPIKTGDVLLLGDFELAVVGEEDALSGKSKKAL